MGPLEPKAGARSVAISSQLVDVLRAQPRRSAFVFSTREGRPYSKRNVYRDFQADAKAFGVPVIRFHDLRHTAATLLLGANVPVPVVAQRLGHTAQVLMERYAHVIKGQQQVAADTLNSLFGGAK